MAKVCVRPEEVDVITAKLSEEHRAQLDALNRRIAEHRQAVYRTNPLVRLYKEITGAAEHEEHAFDAEIKLRRRELNELSEFADELDRIALQARRTHQPQIQVPLRESKAARRCFQAAHATLILS